MQLFGKICSFDRPQTAMSEPATPPTFEAAMSELEAIVAAMESGQLSLEESLSAYQRGATLLQTCQQFLDNARQQVELLENGVLKNFFQPGQSHAD